MRVLRVVVGPLLIGLAAVFVSARGTSLPIIPIAIAAFALAIAIVLVVARRHPRTAAAGVVALALLVLFLTRYAAAPLAALPPFVGELPPASPPPELALYRLPTGSIHRTASFGYRGGAFGDRRDFAMTAVLVVHPRGDLLIDTGFGRQLDEQLRQMPLFFRALTDAERTRSVAEQLDAVGYDRARLRVLATHAHWDHVSGLPELGAPLLLTSDERRFVERGGWVTAVARGVGARIEEYAFDGGPYLGFAASRDLFGDGSVVIVPAPGHTPGSVIVFVALSSGRRYAFVGDLVWQREGITEREERPWPARALGDDDPAGVRASIVRMASLAARFPQLTIAPAHDARGFADLPTVESLSPRGTRDAPAAVRR